MATPGATITTKDNSKFSLLIAGYWKDVAAELELGGEKITNIQTSSSEYPTQKDKAFQMLEELRVKGCTYMQLAEALRRLDKGGHAKEVLPPRGTLLGNFWCFEDEKHLIAKGSKGNKVYEGILVSSGEDIAVKRIFTGNFDMKEADHLQKMDHPNIIKCFAVESQDQYIYLALELCKNTLRTCVGDNDFHRENSGIGSLQCLKDVTAALRYLHDRNICHRDIKPDNILLSVSEPVRFILADFNTAKRSSLSESASTHFGSFVGTVGYVAPEVMDPTAQITVKSDIFPLGCVFYYTLTGKCHPFGSVRDLRKCQQSINRGQPPVLKETDFLEHSWTKPIIAAMIAFHHHQRPSAADVLDYLEVCVLAGEECEPKILRFSGTFYSVSTERSRAT